MTSKPHYVKHKEINKSKWDECINKSFNRLPYALSWYLDLISPNWDAIILNEYEAVMPLTHRSRFGIKYITKPVLCNQLGVFSTIHNSTFMVNDFIKAIPKKFVKIDMPLNAFNKTNLTNLSFETRISQTISLNKSSDEIEGAFKKQHRKNIRKFESIIHEYKIEKDSFKTLIALKKNMLTKKGVWQSPADNFVYENTLGTLVKGGYSEIHCVKNSNDEYTGGIGFFKVDDFIFLVSFSTKKGKKLGDKYYILSEFLKRQTNSECTFDFMGSSIKGIYDWNKGFGAEELTFPFIHIKRLPFL